MNLIKELKCLCHTVFKTLPYLHRKGTKSNKSLRMLLYSLGEIVIYYLAQIQCVFWLGLNNKEPEQRRMKIF